MLARRTINIYLSQQIVHWVHIKTYSNATHEKTKNKITRSNHRWKTHAQKSEVNPRKCHDTKPPNRTQHDATITQTSQHLSLTVTSTSNTSWPCWRSKLSRCHLCSIWVSTSRCAPAHATLDLHPSHCCACHFDRHNFPDDRSALPHPWLGTQCHLMC